MGNPSVGRNRPYILHLQPITHDATGVRVTMTTKEAAGIRGLGGQRIRIPHGNMHAKLPNYIGQVLECKADHTQYALLFAKIRRTLAERGASSARPGLLS